MTTIPQPSTLGEILDLTASLYRRDFLKFLGIAAAPAAVLLGCMGAMVLLFTMAGTKPGSAMIAGLGVVAVFLIAMPLYLGTNALSSAAMTQASSAAFFDERTTIRDSYRAAWKHGWRYMGVYVLQALLVAAAPLVAWTVTVLVLAAMGRRAGAAPSVAATGMLVAVVMVLAVYVVWMLLRVSLAFPAAVVEDSGPGMALKRAATLSVGTRGRILVLYLLGMAISWIVSVVLLLPLFLLALIPNLNTPAKAQMLGTVVIIVFYGISFATQALTKPIYGIALVLFYYDQRVRKEGFDIELLMRRAGMESEVAMPVELGLGLPAVEQPAEVWVSGFAGDATQAFTASPAPPAPPANSPEEPSGRA